MNISEHLALLMKKYDDAHKEGAITTGQFEALMDGALQAVEELDLMAKVEVPDPGLDTSNYIEVSGPGGATFSYAPDVPCRMGNQLFLLRDAGAKVGAMPFFIYGYGGTWTRHWFGKNAKFLRVV
jgi:hypothetical protein